MRFRTRHLIVAGALSLTALPAWAQAPGGAPVQQNCRDAPATANGPCASRAYEQWQDGSPARAATAPPAQPAPSNSVGGYNRFYGFGR